MKAEEARQAHVAKTARIVENARKMRNWHDRTPREKEASRVHRKKAPTLRDFEYASLSLFLFPNLRAGQGDMRTSFRS